MTDSPIHEFAGGQINHNFQIGDEYGVKIQKDLDVLLNKVPLIEQMIQFGVKFPKIVDSGILEDKEYIVMRKVLCC